MKLEIKLISESYIAIEQDMWGVYNGKELLHINNYDKCKLFQFKYLEEHDPNYTPKKKKIYLKHKKRDGFKQRKIKN